MLEQIKPYNKENAEKEAQMMREKIKDGAESYNEAESLLDVEKIKDHFDSDLELKKQYIKDIKFHESKENIVLEVIVNGDGLNQDSSPTEEQYKILKYLTAGEYPNINNIIHVNRAHGYGDAITDLDALLPEKMKKANNVGNEIGTSNIESSGLFCSPSNYYFSTRKEHPTFIFRPEDLDRFLKKTVEDLFDMPLEKYMSDVVKPILNSKEVLSRAVGRNAEEYREGIFEPSNKFPKQLLDNEPKELNIPHNDIIPFIPEEDGGVPQKLIQNIVEKYGGGLYKGRGSLIDEKKIGPFTTVDLVGFCNLVMHVAQNYLKLVHDKTKTGKDLKAIGKQLYEKTEDILSGNIAIDGVNESDKDKLLKIFHNTESYESDGQEDLLHYCKSKHIKFMDKEDMKQLEEQGGKAEEMSWAYLSQSGWDGYGFPCLVKNGDENLKFDDASVIISRSSINSKTYDIKKEDGPRVLFVMKK